MASEIKKSSGRSSRFDQFIDRELGQTVSRLRTAEIAWAVLAASAWLLALLLGFVIVDAWLVNLGDRTRLVGLATMAAGAVLIFCYGALPPLVRRINPQYVARMIERSGSSFHNSLLNYLLVRGQPDRTRTMVYEAVSQRAANDLSLVDEDRRVDFSSAIRMGAVVASLVALLVAYIIFSPRNPWSSIGRILAPGARIAPASVVTVTNVTPGDTIVYYGDRLKVSCNVRGQTADQPVQLVYSSRDGQIKQAVVLMEPSGNGMEFGCEISGGGEGILTDLDYFVSCGDGRSPEYLVSVRANPTVTVSQVEIIPPEYTRLPPAIQLGRGEIRAPEGSTVRISATSNQDMQIAWIELVRADHSGTLSTNAEKVEVVQSVSMEVSDIRQARGEFVLLLDENGKQQKYSHYRVRFRTTRDQRNELASLHPVQVIPDVAPEVSIVRPESSPVELPVNARLPVEVRASDMDYEISSVELVLDHRGSRLLDRTLDLPKEKENQQVTSRYLLDPATLNLKVGDEVVFFARALDNRISPYSYAADPNVSVTPPVTVKIVAADPNAAQSGHGSPVGDSGDSNKPNPAENAGPDKEQPKNPDNQPSTGNKDGTSGDKSGGGDKSGTGESAKDEGSKNESQPGKTEGASGNDKQQESGESGSAGGSSDKTGEQGAGQSGSAGKSQSGAEGGKQDGSGQASSAEGGGSKSGEQSQTGSGEPGKTSGQAGSEANEKGGSSPASSNSGGNQASTNDSGAASGSGDSQNAGGSGASGEKGSQAAGDPAGGDSANSGAGDNGSANSGSGTSATEGADSQGTTGAQNSGNESPATGSGGVRDNSLRDGSVEQLSKQATASEKFEALQEYLKNNSGASENSGSSGQSSNAAGDQSGANESSQGGSSDPAGIQSGKTGSEGNPQDGSGASGEAGGKSGGAESAGSNPSQSGNDGSGSGQDPQRDPSGNPGAGGEAAQKSGSAEEKDAGQSGTQSGSGDEQSTGQSGTQAGAGDDKTVQQGGTDPAGNQSDKSGSASSSSASGNDGSGTDKGRQGSQAEGAGSKTGSDSQPGTGNSETGEKGTGGSDKTSEGQAGSGNQQTSEKGQPGQGASESGDPAGSNGNPAGSSQPSSSATGENSSGGSNSSGSGSRGGSGAGGVGPAGNSGGQQTDITPKEAEQVEYNRAATDLILKDLDGQKERIDPELLQRMNMTEQDLKEFLQRWQKMRDAANSGDPVAKKRYAEALRSLDLRNAGQQPADVLAERDQVTGMAEDGGVNRPSAELAPEFRAFMKSRNRVENASGNR